MQTGNAHQCKGFADNRHSKAGTLTRLCMPPCMGNTIAAVFLNIRMSRKAWHSLFSIGCFCQRISFCVAAVCPAPATA